MSLQAADRKGAANADPTGAASTDVIMFTATNASKVNPVPSGWPGETVRIQPIGTDLYYFWIVVQDGSTPTATIALPPAATDVGAQAGTQGELIKSGAILEIECPNVKQGGQVWFARFGVTAAQSVQLTKASGRPGVNTVT